MSSNSLRTRFLLATVPVMLLLVGGTFFGFDLIITRIIDGLSQRFAVQQVYYDRSRTLYPLLQEIALARRLAQAPALIAWARDEDNPTLRERGLEELESAREAFNDKSYFFTLRKSGNYYHNNAINAYAGNELRYTLSPDDIRDAWFYVTMRQQKDCNLNIDTDRVLKTTNIWINCLVRDGNRVLGAAGTGIELTHFINSVVSVHDDGVLNMFIDGDGAIQAHPDVNEIAFRAMTKTGSDKKTIFDLIPDADERQQLRDLFTDLKADPKTPKTLRVTFKGQPMLIGAGYLPEIDWFNLTVLQPRVWALGKSFAPLAILMIAGMLLTLAFIAMFLHKLVLSRIDRLDDAVRETKDHDRVPELADDQGDEISRLTQSFIELTSAVQRNRQDLEQKIAERTRELVNARDEAQAANRAKSEFLAMMSHDLRTPLNAIIGFSSMMQSEVMGPLGTERYKSYIDDIHKSGSLLLSMINALLDISKIEAGKLDLAESVHDVPSMLGDLVRQIEPFAESRGVTVELHHPDDLPMLLCDERSLAQIVNNLVSNSIKFSDRGQAVGVHADLNEAGEFFIRVEDRGIGMADDDIKKALEPFSQIKSDEARNQDGTGLGLHVSNLLMAAHGGRLEITSALGEGTVISAVFPTSRVADRTQPEDASA